MLFVVNLKETVKNFIALSIILSYKLADPMHLCYLVFFQAVTKAKLGYDPLEVNPEDMVRFAKEKPQV